MKVIRRLAHLFQRHRFDRELAEEIEAHRAMRQAALEARGVRPEDAAVESCRALGNVTLAREDARGAWIAPWLDSVAQDARYAVRSLIGQPGFTVVAAGTIALAVGLNTTFFTVFSAYALRPWAVPEPDRVVRVFNGYGAGGFSRAAAEHLASATKAFEGLFAARLAGTNVIGEDAARVAWVTGGYFSTLHAPIARGRAFSLEDDRLRAPAVAVLSDGYWRRRFAADPSIAGRVLSIEGVSVTVAGVAAPGFIGTAMERTDLWMPLSAAAAFRPNERWVRDELLNPAAPAVRGSLLMAGRLAPGVMPEQARAELDLLAAQFQEPAAAGHRIVVRDTTVLGGPKGDASGVFVNMFAAVALVLLLACANVGNLLLARGAARRREVAVRLSLGAARARLVRQLMTESFVLAAVAAVPGLLMARWLPAVLLNATADRPMALRLDVDVTVIAYALVLCVVSTLLFGLAPALHATRTPVSSALKDGHAGGSARFALRSVLLAAQVGVSVVLLVGAALLVRGVSHARGLDHGFDIDAVTVVSLDAPASAYDAARTRAFSAQLAQAIETLGGATPVAITQALPFGSGNIKGSFAVPGRSDDEFNSVYEVSPRYFEVLGMRLLAGRLLQAADSGRGVIVNESLARRFWTTDGAVGQRIVVPPTNGWNTPGDLEIVGVVGDAHTTDLLQAGPVIYQPFSGRGIPYVLARAGGRASIERIEAAVRRLDPRIRTRVAPLSSTIDARLRGTRVMASLALAVGALALTLASVGMFGVFAFWVQQRTREIGVRMALGARGSAVLRAVLASSARAIAAGLALGWLGAVAAAGLLRQSLFGLSALDPIAYLAAMAVLAAAALLATAVPARRAMRVDPVVALRHE
jgi:putative ABC transport system permease protein